MSSIDRQPTELERNNPGQSSQNAGQSSQNDGAAQERHGTYEPDDSRNVTGASGQGIGAPGGADQQIGEERWSGGQQSQSQPESHSQAQAESGDGGQMGEIREHMEIIGADGVHLGTVDAVEDHRIKLTKSDSPSGHQDHHHYISRGLVAGVEGDRVRLSATAANAYAMEEEK